jgi:isoquinoline 1-oxidoreductase beta subunit
VTTRREFVKLVVAGGSALTIGFSLDEIFAEPARATFEPNGWIRIDSDDLVTLTVGKSEMGQGVRTALPMILAEELGADWSKVRLRQASPGPQFTRLGTGGSFSVSGSWPMLRLAGATAREMLIAAAARRWNVEPAALRTENGFVIGDGRRERFGALVAEAATMAVPEKPPLKGREAFSIVGTDRRRLDARDIVTGKASYGLDARLPGLRYATLVRPKTLEGSIGSFDATETKKVSGVLDVVRISKGVAVVATNSWGALKGRERLKVDHEAGPNETFSSEKHFALLHSAAKEPGILLRKEGEGAAALASASRTLTATYEYPFYAHAPLEPMNCVAHVHDGQCDVIVSTQAPNDVQNQVARLLQLPPEKVNVTVTLVGGGFGRRLGWDYALEAAELSNAISAPVQLFWTREDDMKHGYFQAASVHQIAAGVDAQGKLMAWTHKKVSSLHNARRRATPEQLKDPVFFQGSAAWGVYDFPYDVASIETFYVPVETPVPIGPWRAVFSPSSVFARECFVDELAHALGKDPLDYRLQLLGGADSVTAGSLTISRPRMRRVLEELRRRSEWGKKTAAGRGRGFACNVYDGDTHVAYTADVHLRDGVVQVDRVVCVIDCGLVVNPLGVRQQVESGVIWGLSSVLKGEITFRDGAAEQSTFGDFEVLRIDETPRIETYIVGADAAEPFGVGEPVVSPIMPAVMNAVFAATGRRVRRVPLRKG